MPYRHPGRVFLSQQGQLQSEGDVLRYVEFLRWEAALSDEPPINLHQVYHHFEMPTPLRAPLDEQQGILVDSNTGIILIKETDPIVRQRFTEGHELMELLFDANDQVRAESYLPKWSEQRKERLCDQGAAELLMPATSFVPRLKALGMSLETGRSLAKLYQTSLLATLIRMVHLGSGKCALVVWHSALKPTETKRQKASDSEPEKKLRIWWRIQTQDWSGGFIPKDKSVVQESVIGLADRTGQAHSGSEQVHLGWGSIACWVEAIPIQIGDKACILSLLHLSTEQ